MLYSGTILAKFTQDFDYSDDEDANESVSVDVENMYYKAKCDYTVYIMDKVTNFFLLSEKRRQSRGSTEGISRYCGSRRRQGRLVSALSVSVKTAH